VLNKIKILRWRVKNYFGRTGANDGNAIQGVQSQRIRRYQLARQVYTIKPTNYVDL
jgi:hypothetical protein